MPVMPLIIDTDKQPNILLHMTRHTSGIVLFPLIIFELNGASGTIGFLPFSGQMRSGARRVRVYAAPDLTVDKPTFNEAVEEDF
jgi:hypothetical protein